MAQVKVIKSTADGIHLAIDGQEIGLNRATGVFKAKQADGKWAAIQPSNFIRAIATRQLESRIAKSERIKNARTEPRRYSAAHCDRQAFLTQERSA